MNVLLSFDPDKPEEAEAYEAAKKGKEYKQIIVALNRWLKRRSTQDDQVMIADIITKISELCRDSGIDTRIVLD